jgi:hypothetical protein
MSLQHPDMSIRKTFVSIMVGFIFAGLTSWSFRNFVVSDCAAPFRSLLDVFLMPGLLVSVALSGNVHTYEAGPAAMGNFIFYFVVTYICVAVWQKYRTGFKPS